MSAAVTIAAFPVAALALLVLLRSRLAARLVAVPTGERWHDRATPTFGGIGIFVGFVGGVGIALAAGALEPTSELLGILGGAAVLFVAGLVDDLAHLNPLAKLSAQFAAAGIAIASGLQVQIVSSDALALAIGLVWLVGMTNAFNLLDNMDGLAATLATISCAALALDAVTEHPNRAVLVIALALGSACLAFLPFNLRPGRRAVVFMGDSGSQVLGFVLASLTLASSWKVAGTTTATVILPLLVLAVPILDTSLVTARRLLERRPVTQGGRDHTSHRLVYYGLSEGRAVALLAAIAAAVGATGVTYTSLGNARVTTVGVLVTFVLLVQFAGLLGDLEEHTRRGDPIAAQPSLRALLFQPKRLVEVLADFLAITLSFLAAYLLVVGGAGSVSQRSVFVAALPVLLATRYVVYVTAGMYRRVWRFAGTRDAFAIVVATAVSECLGLALLLVLYDLGDFPTRVFVLDAVFCAAAIGATRFGLRLVGSGLGRRSSDRRRTLIVGAGGLGRSLARELAESHTVQVVGFLDDNGLLRRRRILGLTVLGTLDEIERTLAEARPDEVLVTIPGAARDRLTALVAACDEHGIACRFVRRETVDAVRVALEVGAD